MPSGKNAYRAGYWPWFWSFAPRFLLRHPTKWRTLYQHASGARHRAAHVAALTGVSKAEVESYFGELDRNPDFLKLYNDYPQCRSYVGPAYGTVYYALCRAMKPEKIVETGVAWGFSSWFILQALERNGRGQLYSIDLPHKPYEGVKGQTVLEKFPPGKATGWLVPESLRGRWNLLLGDSQQLLPELLQELAPVDIFIHDSEHTYDFMKFEYNAAWPALRSGGVLLSDDILKNLLDEFSEQTGSKPYYFRAGLAGMRKN